MLHEMGGLPNQTKGTEMGVGQRGFPSEEKRQGATQVSEGTGDN